MDSGSIKWYTLKKICYEIQFIHGMSSWRNLNHTITLRMLFMITEYATLQSRLCLKQSDHTTHGIMSIEPTVKVVDSDK